MQPFADLAAPAAEGSPSLQHSMSLGARALFAYQRSNGGTVSEHSFSPVGTALALLSLHLADPSDPDGLVGRGVTHLCRTQNPDGGWASPQARSEPLATAHVADVLGIIAPQRAAAAIAAATALLDRIGRPEAGLAWTLSSRHQRLLIAPMATLEILPVPPMPRTAGSAHRLLGPHLPAYASITLGRASARPRRLPWLQDRQRGAALSLLREIHDHEGATGALGGDPWVTGQICVGLLRSGLAEDIAHAAVKWLKATASPQGTWTLAPRDVRWASHTATALIDAGHGGDHRLRATRVMLRGAQQTTPFLGPSGPAGGWSSGSTPSWPTTLASAEAVTALARLSGSTGDEDVRRGVAWLCAQQDSAGSWSLAVRDTKPGPLGPCPQLTAQVVLALLDAGRDAGDGQVAKALRWLLRSQEADGTFSSQWYRGRTIATATVVEALARAGEGGHPVFRRALGWLTDTQRVNGAWSAGDGAGVSTVEETAAALSALLAAGTSPAVPSMSRAARWLMDRQRTDGTWPAEAVHEYVRLQYRYADDVIATSLAVRALGRLARAS